MTEEEFGGQELFAFYGSLRPGMYNFEALRDEKGLEHLGNFRIGGFKMYSLGWYPMVFLARKHDEIVVDVFKITNSRVKARIDGMEIGAGYNRHLVTIPELGETPVMIYVGTSRRAGEFDERRAVKSGDWVSHQNNPTEVNESSTV